MAESPILRVRVSQAICDALQKRAAAAGTTPSEEARRILARSLKQTKAVEKRGRPRLSEQSKKS